MANTNEAVSMDLNLKPYQLFVSLYNIKGTSDASAYEMNVCNYYSREILDKVRHLGVNITASIRDRYGLETAIKNYNSLWELYELVYSGFENGLNFKMLNIQYPFYSEISSVEFGYWIDAAKYAIASLPRADMYYGEFFTQNPMNVLFYRSANDFSLLPDEYELLAQAKEEKAKYLLPEDYWWVVEIVEALENYDPNDRNIIGYTQGVADEFIKTNPSSMLSTEEVLNTYFAALKKINADKMSNISGKRLSFWIGFGVWGFVMLLAGLATFATGIVSFPVFSYGGSGFLKNIGFAFLFCVICGGVLCIEIFLKEHSASAMIPFLPRGLCSLLISYWLFGSGYADQLGTYKYPFYVFGIAILLCSLAMDFSDFFIEYYDWSDRNEIINNLGKSRRVIAVKFRSNNRWTVMFSPVNSILPIITFFLYTYSFSYLNIIAVWVISILLALGTLAIIFITVSADE